MHQDSEHLTEMDEIEQERDHYRDMYNKVQKELEEVKSIMKSDQQKIQNNFES